MAHCAEGVNTANIAIINVAAWSVEFGRIEIILTHERKVTKFETKPTLFFLVCQHNLC